MKTVIITLFASFISLALRSQEYSPLTVVLSGKLNIENYDNSKGGYTRTVKTPKQAGDSITLLKPIFNHTRQLETVKTAEGFVRDRDLRAAISREEFSRYWDWATGVDRNKEPEESAKVGDFYAGQINKMNRIKAVTKANTWHDNMTIFTGGLEVNLCHSQLLEFIEKHMKMSEQSNDQEGGYVISKCVQRTGKGNPENLTIRYKVKDESGYLFPEQVEITGTSRRTIELFVSYWPTKIHFNDAKKGREYTCYMMPDKITLSIDKAGKAKIRIINSQ
ncbi:MAG: hypothetical protein LBL07_18615 [Tannerella sp.]|jgi:hypothetical protein|nr:hypothetical protein [Tannerella sp.]